MPDEERERIETEIRTLKQLLKQSDYKSLKHADGVITDEDYAETNESRQGWRDRINELEAMLERAEA